MHERTVGPPSAVCRRLRRREAEGPYRRWHHRHEFLDVPGGTEAPDIVDYEMPLGPLGTSAHRLFVRRSVEQIFDYRRQALAGIFGS